MATYAIGDIQGCYDDLRRLLDRIDFQPEWDRLWFVGDLVNRGPDSLSVLRFVKQLGDRALTVLGNHDLHLLALAAGNHKHPSNPGLDRILKAPDRDELIDWLRHCPLLFHSAKKDVTLIHAGLPPQWTLEQAMECAREVEQQLQGPGFADLCRQMYGAKPVRWEPRLTGMERWRFTINCLTRLRYCSVDGHLALKQKGAPGSQPGRWLPWFRVPGRRSQGRRILFGHWSTLGYVHEQQVWCLDSGCLWGGRLTALRVRRNKDCEPLSIDCPDARLPVHDLTGPAFPLPDFPGAA